jgi:hypothetical protein
MRIGIDFDNTIACYDDAFHRAAVAQGLIPATVGRDKTSVRDHLRGLGRDPDFTLLQGYVYGPGMQYAGLYPGLREALAALRAAGHRLFIVSHRTRTPFAGPQHDLHAAARDFVARQGLTDNGFAPDEIWFEETRGAKLARASTLGCDVFIDDLPEVLSAPEFSTASRAILFDPESHRPDGVWQSHRFERYATWSDIAGALLRANA